MIYAFLKRTLKMYPRAFVCVCSLLFSSAAFVSTPTLHKTITIDYEPQVRNLIAGKGLTSPDGQAMDRYPPIYPTSLASLRIVSGALGLPESWLLFAFAAICLALASIFTYNMASLVVGSERALIAAILFAIHPQVLFGVVVPLSETPFLAVLNCSVWLFLSALTRKERDAKFILGAGLLSGVAMLLRPAGMFVPLIFVAIELRNGGMPLRSRLRSSALLLFAATVTLLPWEFYGWHHSGKVVMISTGGVPTMRDGLSFNNKTMRSHTWLPSGAGAVVDDVWQHYSRLPNYSSIMRLMLEEVRKSPLGVAELYSFKALRSWYGTDSQQPFLEILNAMASACYLLPGLLGMRNYFRNGRRGKGTLSGALLVLLILYFWGLTTLTLSIVRYMVPAIAFICTFVPLCVPFKSRVLTQATADNQSALQIVSSIS